MSVTVSVKFRQASDYSNKIKDVIIGALPGTYKVSRQELNDLDNRGVHVFDFINEAPANNFAKFLFGQFNEILDVQTSFKVVY